VERHIFQLQFGWVLLLLWSLGGLGEILLGVFCLFWSRVFLYLQKLEEHTKTHGGTGLECMAVNGTLDSDSPRVSISSL